MEMQVEGDGGWRTIGWDIQDGWGGEEQSDFDTTGSWVCRWIGIVGFHHWFAATQSDGSPAGIESIVSGESSKSTRRDKSSRLVDDRYANPAQAIRGLL